ncbi:hypothetical protein ACWGDX_29820 [Streptomyces sp. NPDC055025]
MEVFFAVVFFTVLFAVVFAVVDFPADAFFLAGDDFAVVLVALLAADPAAVDFFAAVFFTTMAATPSHMVILLANRAGTINRHQPRGNGARRRFGPPHGVTRRASIRCAQLDAG